MITNLLQINSPIIRLYVLCRNSKLGNSQWGPDENERSNILIIASKSGALNVFQGLDSQTVLQCKDVLPCRF